MLCDAHNKVIGMTFCNSFAIRGEKAYSPSVHPSLDYMRPKGMLLFFQGVCIIFKHLVSVIGDWGSLHEVGDAIYEHRAAIVARCF
jgi:hypothetical protein